MTEATRILICVCLMMAATELSSLAYRDTISLGVVSTVVTCFLLVVLWLALYERYDRP